MKRFITDSVGKEKLLASFMRNLMLQQLTQNSGGEGYLHKYEKH